MNDKLRYPIGVYNIKDHITCEELNGWISDIAQLPHHLRNAVEGLTPTQLDTPYRPGGWTVRQVVHHIADSHMNSVIRVKLALTEDCPTIKPYREELWAQLNDSEQIDIESSLRLLESLHERWSYLLTGLSEEQWKRTFRHPDSGIVDLSNQAGLYSWHGKHHTAHITSLRERMDW